MAGKPAISKDEILDVAYARAQSDGLSSLSIRSVARECGVAVGTLYNYFPDKASLVSEIILRFWQDVAQSPKTNINPQDGGVVEFCRSLSRGFKSFLAQFKTNWLHEISMLDERTLELVYNGENEYRDCMLERVSHAVESDGRIRPRVRERLDNAELAHLIWRVMFESLRADPALYGDFLHMLELALYE